MLNCTFVIIVSILTTKGIFNKESKMIYLTDSFNQTKIQFIEDVMNTGTDVRVVSKSELQVGNAEVYFLPMILTNQIQPISTEENPLLALNVEVPEFWRIRMAYDQGTIMDYETKRGVIHYFEPGSCMTKMVEWWDTTGKVFRKDYYHRNGWRYKQELFDEAEQVISIHYFSPKNQLLMVEDVEKRSYTVFNEDRTYLYNEKQLWAICVEKLKQENERIVVGDVKLAEFLQPKSIIACYTDKMPLEEKAIQQWLALVDELYIYHYSVYHKIPRQENIHHISPLYKVCSDVFKHRALIVTHTQDVEKIEELVDALPALEFHIAAITQMGVRLMNLEVKENVRLYPGILQHEFEALLDICSIYLDINHSIEILDSVDEALDSGLLLFAFQETCHREAYIHPEHLYGTEEVQGLIEKLTRVMNSQEEYTLEMQKQLEWIQATKISDYVRVFQGEER